ncbi:glutamine amidotransferase [Cellulomonas cellasea]|uniref:GMP synthase (Glutamine-hydrolyzing) n=1 Tax=Cellulomonas cellasea TaxID=43670 RepID=A0A7W4YDG4_9CELL|nr:glutamine amidotransferase [Cellulomonas cellasea]MBB2924682.1 GMP synthase (glutamine-hydrolyzing) [Cellulomonas cellasea]
MRPFLLLASRADDPAADGEYAAMLRYGGLTPERLHRVRMEAGPLPPIDLDRYAGVLVGGSPFNSADPPERKSEVQHRVEGELVPLLDEIVARDHPFLGACYGVGTLGAHQGAVIDGTYAEEIGSVEVTLTDAGAADPLLEGVPRTFEAFVGHREACRTLPAHAVLLASSATCPVQMFRVREHLYATQFHPELDVEGIVTRIEVYRHAGYFPPEDAHRVEERVRRVAVTHPPTILRNFVRLFG